MRQKVKENASNQALHTGMRWNCEKIRDRRNRFRGSGVQGFRDSGVPVFAPSELRPGRQGSGVQTFGV